MRFQYPAFEKGRKKLLISQKMAQDFQTCYNGRIETKIESAQKCGNQQNVVMLVRFQSPPKTTSAIFYSI